MQAQSATPIPGLPSRNTAPLPAPTVIQQFDLSDEESEEEEQLERRKTTGGEQHRPVSTHSPPPRTQPPRSERILRSDPVQLGRVVRSSTSAPPNLRPNQPSPARPQGFLGVEPRDAFYPLYMESDLLFRKYQEHEKLIDRIARIIGTSPAGNLEGVLRKRIRHPEEESMRSQLQQLTTALSAEKAN